MTDSSTAGSPLYDRLAQFYDWEHDGFEDDTPLYQGYARATGGPVLAAACGTGRVLIPLASDGLEVIGVDASQAMLDVARTKIAAGATVKGRIDLVQQDLRSLKLDRRFKLAFVALGSFHHLTTAADQRAALRGLAAHLDKRGMLLIDLINPASDWLAAADGTLVLQKSGPLSGADPGLLTKFVARTGHQEDQGENWFMIYDRTDQAGSVTRVTVSTEVRYIFRYEAEMLLEEAGFRVVELYGGYDMEPYGASSSRMIFVAERL